MCTTLFWKVCVRCMGGTNECICNMIKAMQTRPDMVGVACESLHNMFDKNHTELVQQVSAVLWWAWLVAPIFKIWLWIA